MRLGHLLDRLNRKRTGPVNADQSAETTRSVVIYGFPTDETFDERVYLKHNPDIAAAVRLGGFASGREHFDKFKHAHTHKVPFADAPEKIKPLRERKMRKVVNILKREFAETVSPDNVLDVLTAAQRQQFGVISTKNISSNDYDGQTIALIDQHAEGLLLDCGAGSRSIYYDNVVNYEIARYPSTDVIGVAEDLPFEDNSFDAVFSYAVLEHVKQPFAAAKEIIRVLKPGGTLRAIVPFLQPLHGFPSHYFNMTQFGLRSLFENDLDVTEQFVGPGGGPIWTMYTLLHAWYLGLPAKLRDSFLDLKLRDLHVHPLYQLDREFVTQLSESATFEIASATGLVGTKR